ncbi:Uncharacterized protein dnm_084190 [Desulfonema magnum]|uniref:Uncharacterized protein n=1 Tax=Desulfonema magnum TaxID=45655 RepID=A0A975BV57_9BACT|nr:Uncharacterized protein dnm_084190 [Desulfonema magnum]
MKDVFRGGKLLLSDEIFCYLILRYWKKVIKYVKGLSLILADFVERPVFLRMRTCSFGGRCSKYKEKE